MLNLFCVLMDSFMKFWENSFSFWIWLRTLHGWQGLFSCMEKKLARAKEGTTNHIATWTAGTLPRRVSSSSSQNRTPEQDGSWECPECPVLKLSRPWNCVLFDYHFYFNFIGNFIMRTFGKVIVMHLEHNCRIPPFTQINRYLIE